MNIGFAFENRFHVAGFAGRQVRLDHDPGAGKGTSPIATTWSISRTTISSRSSIRRAGSWRGTTARRAALQALPGADDPRYVQTDAVWSPDGKYVVFARAEAKEPYPEGQKLAEHANDPDETQIQYDLYRIPFNDGKGGQPEPIAGASQNGMSNTFPKVSPDGRWIVFVKCRNGAVDASRQPALHCSRGRRRGAAPAMQYALDELLAQLLAQRPLAGVLLEEPLALHADVSDAPG